MNAARRLLSPFRDSPTHGLDRANLVSGFSIGTAGLALNAAVLLLVMPLMLDPDEPDFLVITENVEFGQLLALILLGGAAAFATLLIPLRLLSVFWGPRIGRYFDQIVLSGISPFRFVIGKATSQNLFLGLILFLLLPYLVLSLTLGGVDWVSFLAGLFLLWLYCIQLALVMLWASLYLNELLAAVMVVGVAAVLSVLGCLPMPFQPFVLTPFPALIHPVFTAIPYFDGRITEGFLPVFLSCAVGMSAVAGTALAAIYLGPLYGIIRENSTFGEVVRTGDASRKRWFRLRLHIQRPSEIAFFYENRDESFRRHEGLLRWGFQLLALLAISGAVSLVIFSLLSTGLATQGGMRWWVYDFHLFYLTILGCGLALATFVFSHAKNSMYLRVPFCFGKTVEVHRLDTTAFLIFLLFSTAAAIATPIVFDQFVAMPLGHTVFPEPTSFSQARPVDYFRVAVEGSIALSTAGLVVYALHRLACQLTWLRSAAFAGVAGSYFIAVCLLPIFFAMLFLEVPQLRRVELFSDWAPVAAMASPLTVLMVLFNEMGARFPSEISTAPFYLGHGVLLGATVLEIRRRGRKLREEYLLRSAAEADR